MSNKMSNKMSINNNTPTDTYVIVSHGNRNPTRSNRVKHNVSNLILVTFSDLDKKLSVYIVDLLLYFHKEYPDISTDFNNKIISKINGNKLSLTDEYISLIFNIILKHILNSIIIKISANISFLNFKSNYDNLQEFYNSINNIINEYPFSIPRYIILHISTFTKLIMYVLILNKSIIDKDQKSFESDGKYNLKQFCENFNKALKNNAININDIINFKISKTEIQKIDGLHKCLDLTIIKTNEFTIIKYIRKYMHLKIKVYKKNDLLPNTILTLPSLLQYNVNNDSKSFESMLISDMAPYKKNLQNGKITEEDFNTYFDQMLTKINTINYNDIHITLYGIRLLSELIKFNNIHIVFTDINSLKEFFRSYYYVYHLNKKEPYTLFLKKYLYKVANDDDFISPKTDDTINKINMSDLINNHTDTMNTDKLNILYSFHCSVFTNKISNNNYTTMKYETNNNQQSVSSSLKSKFEALSKKVPRLNSKRKSSKLPSNNISNLQPLSKKKTERTLSKTKRNAISRTNNTSNANPNPPKKPAENI